MSRCFVFDVDGTLTVSRQKIDPEFGQFFDRFCDQFDVYLVTGSDRPKTVEQIGDHLYNKVKRVYNCSGNDVWEANNNVYTSDWKLQEEPWKYLESKLMYSRFMPKTGWHFEERPGMLNFSILGRRAKPWQRKAYIEWDEKTNERQSIANEFNSTYGDKYNIVADVGGETGLDIYPRGCDKAQVLDKLDYSEIIFVGDKMAPGGNDYSLAQAIISNNCGIAHHVSCWQDTEKYLKTFL